jgi:hypothetical protein
MSMHSWIRNLFTRPATRPIRKGPRRSRLAVEALEGRAVPATFTVHNGDNDGVGSLRAAIAAANDETTNPGHDTITFDPGVTAVTLTTGQLMLTSDVSISGPGADQLSISGNNTSRVFLIWLGNTSLSGLTITGGKEHDAGALDNFGTLTMTDCTVSNSSAEAGGGALVNNGTATLSNCTVSGNSAGGKGGGLFNTGALTLTGCTLTGNSTSFGGGLFNNGGTATLSNCTVSGNSALGGGGVYNSGSTTTLNMSTCTVSANTGGGLFNVANSTATLTDCTVSGNTSDSIIGGVGGDGTITLTNCTISDNTANNAQGGGLDSFGALSMTNCTISGNSALSGGGIFLHQGNASLRNCTISGNSAQNGGGIGVVAGNAALTLGNTIVCGNTAPVNKDIRGSITTDLGHNLLGAALAGTTSGAGNVYTDAPGLAPLGDYGGPTQTRALLPGSPAIDAGDNALAVGIATDPRGAGFPRTVNGTVDIGAFESSGLVAVTSPLFTALAQAIPGGLTGGSPLAADTVQAGVALTTGNIPAAKAALDQLTSDVASAALSGQLGTDPNAALGTTLTLLGATASLEGLMLAALGTPLSPVVVDAGNSGYTGQQFVTIIQNIPGGLTGGSPLAADTVQAGVALTEGNIPGTVTALNSLFSAAVTAAATPGGGLDSNALPTVLTAAGAIQSLVVANPTSTSISAPDITYGAAGSVTVTVSSTSGTPSGNVTLRVDGTQWMTQPLVGGAATFSIPGRNAGNYSLSAFFAAQGGVQGSSFSTGNLHVNKATLTITANDDTKVYGTLRTFSGTAFTQTGLINGDTITGVTETSAGAAAAAAAGAYPIVASAATGTGLGNYNITYGNGLLTVSPLLVVPGSQTAYEDVDKAISGISIGNAASGTLMVTLGVSHGTLTLGTTTGLSVAGNGSGSVTLSGSVAALNAALAGLLYRGSHNYSGSDTLSITVGNGSLSSSGSVAITVKSAAQQAADLQSLVNDLRDAGELSQGQANALSAKLNLKGGNGDVGKVQAFLNQVAAFRNAGLLTQGQADDLLYWGNVLLLSVTQ